MQVRRLRSPERDLQTASLPFNYDTIHTQRISRSALQVGDRFIQIGLRF
jgi:hypothetical protein